MDSLSLLQALAVELEKEYWGDVPSSVAWELVNSVPSEYSDDTKSFVAAAQRAWKGL